MFDYTPKLPELIFYPLVAVEVAHGIALALPTEYQAFCVAAVAVNCALLPVFYVWKESCKYVDGISAGDTPKLQQAAPAKAYLDMNKADAAGNVYAQVVPGVKFNKVRRFASTLLNMRSVSESSVDLREDTWRVHFGGRDGYIKTRVRFENVGAFVRKDARPNSPYIVKRWDVVQEVAKGNERALQ